MNPLVLILPACLLCGCALLNPAPNHSGIHTEWIDPTVRPQDDLYRYTNGKWLASATIPPDRARFGAFDQLRDQSENTLHEILENLSHESYHVPNSDEQKLADLYLSFMDEETLTRLGASSIASTLKEIEACQSVDELVRIFAQLGRGEANLPLAGYVAQDARNTEQYAAYLTQGGLGLPDRDYYLDRQNQRFASFRKAYLTYLEAILTRASNRQPQLAAQQILELETSLAALHWSKVQNRDAVKTYNRFAITELSSRVAPNFPWKAWLEVAGLTGHTDAVVVRQPDYFKGLGDLLQSQPLDVWKDYLTVRLLDGMAPYLGRDFETLHFQFHSGTLRGIPENRPRWKRAVATVEGALGEALGQHYVDLKFTWQQKDRMQTLVEHLEQAYETDLQNLPWMESSTREAALKKLHNLRVKIGYPDQWRDYSSLRILPGDLVGNLLRADEYEYQRNLNKLGSPIDHNEWHMTPQTVNAYYDGSANEIVFPAAILQPPFFDFTADDAVNYGAIGAVIGHEISHGFDDQGSRHDAQGNLNNWWTDNDRHHFEALTGRLVEQYSRFSPLPNYTVNGELTLGENIADNSGLAIAWKAWKSSLAGADSPVIDGFTGAQRFYLGWAQVWRNQVREAEIIRLLKVDPHSPGSVRANATVVNQPGYEAAFGLKPGDQLFREPGNQVIIW